tara:strand:- start:590 stop:880 length:291 start_codon:yes stop_codon:yes gene_type:complete
MKKTILTLASVLVLLTSCTQSVESVINENKVSRANGIIKDFNVSVLSQENDSSFTTLSVFFNPVIGVEVEVVEIHTLNKELTKLVGVEKVSIKFNK